MNTGWQQDQIAGPQATALPTDKKVVKKSALPGLLLLLVLGSGCASTDDLKRERDVLSAELSSQRSKNEQLLANNTQLADELKFKETVIANLKTEKEVRTEETAMVRSEVRSFVRRQVLALTQFSDNAKLNHSIGGEVIDRSKLEGENQLLVDMQHICKSSGTLIGGRVYARAPMQYQFCALRQINNELVAIWVSPLLAAAKPGVSTHSFEIPVSVEKGDRLGLMCAGAIQVPYDVGTGDVRSYTGTLKAGSRINVNDLRGREQRNYSFSLLGLMD